MLSLDVNELVVWMYRFLWPFFRIGAFALAVPLIGTQLVPMRIRLGFALALTLVVAPLLPPQPVPEGLSLDVGIMVAQQLLIGFSLGFMMQLFFQVFVLGGQIISNQMGLGFASISDPANGVSVVVLSQFYLMLTMMLFLAFNGHLIMVEVIVESFRVLPVAAGAPESATLWRLVSAGSWMFASALLLSLPMVIALLVVNLAFGIMTKAAPQLNIFAIGFPFTMLFGLFIVWVGLSDFVAQYQRIASEALQMLGALLERAN